MGTLDRARRPILMNGVIAAVNLAASTCYSAWFMVSVYDAVRNLFAALLLAEAGILFLLGGFFAYGGTIFVSRVRQHILRTGGDWRPEDALRGKKKAVSYILLASLLFAESLLLSLILYKNGEGLIRLPAPEHV